MKTIKNIQVEIVNGNVATADVDCIVVPEFDNCASYGGVGAAIASAGMGDGLEAYDEVAQDKPFKFGDVLMTPSGKAGVHLAHVATAGAKRDKQFMVVLKAMLKVLGTADSLGIRTIAVPEIGTGVIGYLTAEQSAKAIFGAISRFAELYPDNKIEKIILVIYRGSTTPAENVLANCSFLDLKNEQGGKEFDMGAWLIEMGLVR